jgi:hypothetical protein
MNCPSHPNDILICYVQYTKTYMNDTVVEVRGGSDSKNNTRKCSINANRGFKFQLTISLFVSYI